MPDKIRKPRFDDPEKQRKWRTDCRRLDVPGKGTWEWKTSGYEISVYSPTGERTDFYAYAMYGMNQAEYYQFREGQDWDQTYDLTILPSDIKNFIGDNFVYINRDASVD